MLFRNLQRASTFSKNPSVVFSLTESQKQWISTVEERPYHTSCDDTQATLQCNASRKKNKNRFISLFRGLLHLGHLGSNLISSSTCNLVFPPCSLQGVLTTLCLFRVGFRSVSQQITYLSLLLLVGKPVFPIKFFMCLPPNYLFVTFYFLCMWKECGGGRLCVCVHK